MKKIILASTSPRRKELLSILKIPFSIEESNYDEDMTIKLSPQELVKFLSLEKAKAVAKQHKDNVVIIAADTIVALDKRVLGKPKSKEEAREMIKFINGKNHSIFTGLAIIDTETNIIFSDYRETKVFFKNISDKDIESYLKTDGYMDKAGAYSIQGLAAIFVEKIDGDFYSAMGLPINFIAEILEKIDISCFNYE